MAANSEKKASGKNPGGKFLASAAFIAFAAAPAFAQESVSAMPAGTPPPASSQPLGIDFKKAENILSEMDYTATVGWYSKYVCEGIDCWDTGYGLVTLGAAYQDRWFFKFWYGVADGHNDAGDRCGETKLRVDYKLALGALDVIPWFEQSFIHQDNDHGIPRPGLKTVYHITDIFSAGTDFYWQDNDGATGDRGKFRGYYGVYAAAHYDVDERLSLDANIRYGYNGGYVQAAPRGSNALDYTLGASYALTDWCAVDATVAYSQALTALRHEDLGDEFYAGVSLRFSY